MLKANTTVLCLNENNRVYIQHKKAIRISCFVLRKNSFDLNKCIAYLMTNFLL